MKTEISPELYVFLKDWLDWATMPVPDERYRKYWGLCANGWLFENMNRIRRDTIWKELSGIFDIEYPFGAANYSQRADNETLHRCPKRLKWVRKMIENHKKGI